MISYHIERTDGVAASSPAGVVLLPAAVVTYRSAGSEHYTRCYRCDAFGIPAIDGRVREVDELEALPSAVMAAVELCVADGIARSVDA